MCQLNHWRDIVLEQLAEMRDSGLIEAADQIHVTVLGSGGVSWFERVLPNCVIDYYSSNTLEFERPCLYSLKEWSKENDAKVLYLHNKGTTRTRSRGPVAAWRRMMQWFLVDNFRACLNLLEDYDAVGCNVVDKGNALAMDGEDHRLHFSGNFWWANTAHVRRLPGLRDDIVDMRKDRAYWLCERWVLQPYPRVRAAEVYRDPAGPWYYSRMPDEGDYRRDPEEWDVRTVGAEERRAVFG